MAMLRVLAAALLFAALAVAVVDLRHSLDARGGLEFTTFRDVWSAVGLAAPVDSRSSQQGDPSHPTDGPGHQLAGAPVWAAVAIAGLMFWALAAARRRRAFGKDTVAGTGTNTASVSEPPRSDLAQALLSCRSAILGMAVFSGVSNLLMLTGSMFMLQVYDRVLPSRSVPTLFGLAILVVILFAAQGGLDLIRVRLMGRIGMMIDGALSERVYDAVVRLPTRAGTQHDGLQPLRDLDSLRSFLSSLGPTALFDLPWLPLYVLIVFAFHTMLGVTALCGAILLVAFTLVTELRTRRPTQLATEYAAARHKLAEASRRNAEVLMAMGLQQRMAGQWREAHQDYVAAQQRTNDVGGGLGAVAKVLRMMLQSTVLGVGAYLVIQQETSAGVIIAAAILVARALAPVDLAIAHWRHFVAARQSWARLKKLLALLPAPSTPMALPTPVASLSVENVIVVPPGQQKIVVQQLGFTLSSGQGMGIVGPSGSGKSSLARVIVGAWLPARGKVCLDGASLDQWSPELLGRHVGYLPQDVELLAGTVAQNIARFDPHLDAEAIIKAARAADVHNLIVSLPNGYETQIGESGAALSAGQRQRIGLARALYGDPFLVVLDEPDANLDVDGTYALAKAVLSVRTRGGIVIVVAHRHSTLAHLDFLLALQHGQLLAVGPKDAVMKKARMVAPVQEPLRVVPA